jgi:hypothetical protein
LHHEAQKDALMSYEQTLVTTEKAVLSQADSGKASGSTFIERKQMSTKTTLKRIALVAVSALGFGVLSSVAPATAANAYQASFTSPASTSIQTAADGTLTARDIGTVVATLTAGAGDTFVVGTDTVTVTMAAQTASGGVDAAADTAQQAKNNALLARLSFGVQASAVTPLATAVASASNDYNFATTGQNAINNATVSTTATTMLTSPTSASFTSSVGRAFVKLSALTSAQATAASGGVVTFAMTITGGGGKISTFTQTMSLTFGARVAGTATVPTTTGTINAGGSATFTYTSPYTAVLANDTWTERTITLGGTASGSTMSVTATATGGAISLVRTSATTVVATAVKSNIAGAYSVTYTIVVNAAATAAAGETVTAAGFSVTVQPYTPAYNSSVITEATGTNGYYVAAASGGDGIVWSSAADKTNSVLAVTVQQKDQNGANISVAAYAKTVGATITGKGSLTALAGADVVTKSQTETAVNGLLSGNDSFTVYSDGTSGEGTLTITVDGATVATYKLRFYGDAASITATLLRPIGDMSGAVNGTEGAAGAGGLTGTTVRANTLAAVNTTKDVGNTTSAAVAVTVKDANGWAIPTTAPLATSSNRAVVSAATRLFIDSGVSVPSSLQYSAGTFVQHYSYTTLASASGSTSNLTFTFVNAAGTALTTTAVQVAVGGAIAKGTLTFDKASYDPGAVATLTATAVDAAGNKPYDGQDLMANGCESTLNFTCPASFKLVDGKKSREVFAPLASGTWDVTVYDVADMTTKASATVRNPADDAKKAADAATAAAKAAQDAAVAQGKAAQDAADAATDAANEAIDAANAATDAANLAAEAADAATVAAEEARDAADAATAAVEELATQVATLMAALKAQITTLANTVAKIAKKVKA